MKTSFFLIALTMLLACNKKDPEPQQLLTNSNMETGTSLPGDWFFPYGRPDFTNAWSATQSSSPSHSLEISKDTLDATNFSYWQQNYPTSTPGAPTAIPYGKTLVLNVKIKAVNLNGVGAAIAIRTDDATTVSGYALQFITTQSNTSISGTFDWTNYTVKLTGVSSNALYVTIFLLYLPATTGTVYFDDAYLTVQ